MIWLLGTGWALALGIALMTRSLFLVFFVLCQFVFVGLGLLAFPAIGMDATAEMFQSYDLNLLTPELYHLTNIYLLSGVAIAGLTCILLQGAFRLALGQPAPGRVGTEVNPYVLHAAAAVVLLVAYRFVADNWQGFSSLVSAASITDLSDSVSLRREATSEYVQTLVIYNILPAFTIVAMLQFYLKRNRYYFSIFMAMFIVSVLCLLLTFQKRPLLIFIGLSMIGWMLMPTLGSAEGRKIGLFHLLSKGLRLVPVAFVLLFVLYYFYTSYRFQASPMEAFWQITEIIVSRLAGRLSLPAVMYVDYFPRVEPFYGLTNVGAIASFAGWPLYADSSAVFAYYSRNVQNGSMAASAFIDAYGQGGVFTLVVYAFVIGFVLACMDVTFRHTRPGVARVFFFLSSLVFLYYLSQASIFRSLLGYGSVFYFAAWLVGFRRIRTRTAGAPQSGYQA
jgi:hypothetical protein